MANAIKTVKHHESCLKWTELFLGTEETSAYHKAVVAIRLPKVAVNSRDMADSCQVRPSFEVSKRWREKFPSWEMMVLGYLHYYAVCSQYVT